MITKAIQDSLIRIAIKQFMLEKGYTSVKQITPDDKREIDVRAQRAIYRMKSVKY